MTEEIPLTTKVTELESSFKKLRSKVHKLEKTVNPTGNDTPEQNPVELRLAALESQFTTFGDSMGQLKRLKKSVHLLKKSTTEEPSTEPVAPVNVMPNSVSLPELDALTSTVKALQATQSETLTICDRVNLLEDSTKKIEARFKDIDVKPLTVKIDALDDKLQKLSDHITSIDEDKINSRLDNLENRPIYDESHLSARIEALESAPQYDDQPIIERLAKLEPVLSRLEKLENAPKPTADAPTVTYDDAPIVARIEQLEKKPDLSQRVEKLEQKPDFDPKPLLDKIEKLEAVPQPEKYDDSKLISRISQLEQTPNFDPKEILVRVESLEKAPKPSADSTTVAYNDAPLVARIEQLEKKPDFDPETILTRVKNLEQKPEFDPKPILNKIEKLEAAPQPEKYDDSELISRISQLEQKPDFDPKEILVQIEQIKQTPRQTDDSSVIAYNDAPLVARIEQLEKKPSFDSTPIFNRLEKLEQKPEFDPTPIISQIEKLETEKSSVYDDTEIKTRLSALESKETSQYNDSNLKAQIQRIEAQIDHLQPGDAVKLTSEMFPSQFEPVQSKPTTKWGEISLHSAESAPKPASADTPYVPAVDKSVTLKLEQLAREVDLLTQKFLAAEESKGDSGNFDRLKEELAQVTQRNAVLEGAVKESTVQVASLRSIQSVSRDDILRSVDEKITKVFDELKKLGSELEGLKKKIEIEEKAPKPQLEKPLEPKVPLFEKTLPQPQNDTYKYGVIFLLVISFFLHIFHFLH